MRYLYKITVCIWPGWIAQQGVVVFIRIDVVIVRVHIRLYARVFGAYIGISQAHGINPERAHLKGKLIGKRIGIEFDHIVKKPRAIKCQARSDTSRYIGTNYQIIAIPQVILRSGKYGYRQNVEWLKSPVAIYHGFVQPNSHL